MFLRNTLFEFKGFYYLINSISDATEQERARILNQQEIFHFKILFNAHL